MTHCQVFRIFVINRSGMSPVVTEHSKEKIMETALELAIETYVSISDYSYEEVLKILHNKTDDSVTTAVQMLMFCSA